MFIIILSIICIFPLFVLSGLTALPVAIARIRALIARANQLDLMWSLLFVSLHLGGERTASELTEAPVDTVRLVRIFLLLTIECWIVANILIRKRPLARLFSGIQRFMILYTIVALSSMLWSPNLGLSAWKAFEVLVDVSFICFFLSTPSWEKHLLRLWNLTWLLVVLLLCITWAGAVLVPDRAFEPHPDALLKQQLHGGLFILSSNSLGQMAALIGAIAIIRFLCSRKARSKALYIWLLGLAFATLVFSQARTSVVAFIFAVSITIILVKRRTVIPIALVISILLLLSLAVAPILVDAIHSYILRGQSSKLFFSLTGRTYYWGLAWELIKQSPIKGYGFYAGHRANTSSGLFEYSNLDNTYIELMQNLGIMGLFPILFAFILTWKRVLKFLMISTRARRDGQRRQYHKYCCRSSLAIELFIVLLIITIRSFTGPSFQSHHWNLLFFLLILGWGEYIKKIPKAAIKVSWLSHAYPLVATD